MDQGDTTTSRKASPAATGDPLLPLRQRLDAIDRSILDLLAERNGVVQKVAEEKIRQMLPVFVPQREDDKVESFRREAIAHGLDPDWAEDFLRMIMSSSRASQSLDRFSRATPEPRTLLLVGGRGGMGSLYSRVLQASGHHVRCLDRSDWAKVAELARGVDAAIVAVPIRATLRVIDRLAQHLPKTAVLADFTSNKSVVMERMLAAHPGPVVGLHPLHGPDVHNLSKQLMLVCPGRGAQEYGWLLAQCELWGMRLKEVDPTRHDQAMHLIQGLRHFQALLHGSFLRASGMAPGEILDFSSPIYRAELMLLGRIFAQDAELYADIVFSDADRRKLLGEFLAHQERLARLVEQDDKDGFIAEFEAIAAFFGPSAERALDESGYLIHRLADRFS
jgi:chorismate mutase / prephenate dehydrogenase